MFNFQVNFQYLTVKLVLIDNIHLYSKHTVDNTVLSRLLVPCVVFKVDVQFPSQCSIPYSEVQPLLYDVNSWNLPLTFNCWIFMHVITPSLPPLWRCRVDILITIITLNLTRCPIPSISLPLFSSLFITQHLFCLQYLTQLDSRPQTRLSLHCQTTYSTISEAMCVIHFCVYYLAFTQYLCSTDWILIVCPQDE